MAKDAAMCKKHKNTVAAAVSSIPLEQKHIDLFWSKVINPNDGGCWGWSGGCFGNGRPAISVSGRNYLAYRVSWLIHNGSIGARRLICHSCDNPKCCNPEHLFEGTSKDNVDDMYSKGRENRPRGENAPTSKLTTEQVLQIRAEYQKGKWGFGAVMIGKRFGIGPKSVLGIINREYWKHI
jgi:hypothetical protein